MYTDSSFHIFIALLIYSSTNIVFNLINLLAGCKFQIYSIQQCRQNLQRKNFKKRSKKIKDYKIFLASFWFSVYNFSFFLLFCFFYIQNKSKRKIIAFLLYSSFSDVGFREFLHQWGEQRKILIQEQNTTFLETRLT